MILRIFARLMSALESGYESLLRIGLKFRWVTLLVAVSTLGLCVPLSANIGKEFVPQPDNNELYLQYYTPSGSSLEFTESRVKQVEAILRNATGVTQTYTTINTGITQGKNYATTFARLVPRNQRPLSILEMRAPLRGQIASVAGITLTDIGNLSSVGSGKPVQVSIQGPDLKLLERIASEFAAQMRNVPGIVDLDSSSKPSKPIVDVQIDRVAASDAGVSVAQVAAATRPLLAGELTTTWKAPDDENYDVRVRLARGDRNSVADLERLMISSNIVDADGPRAVSLKQIAKFSPGFGPSQINRSDLNREIRLSANVQGRPPGSVGTEIEALQAAATPQLPPGYRFVTGGATKDLKESLGYAVQALALGVIFIYMILDSQFGSFTQPVAIMASLPLSLIGVVIALVSWRSTLNMFSVIGFILLMGLVTKNAILLVDYANQERSRGVAKAQALLNAARVRLRPILMTTLAMIFGMLPLALGLGEGSEQRAPLAHAVIGGVVASTLLTLIVVPVFYSVIDGGTNWIRKRFRLPMRFSE